MLLFAVASMPKRCVMMRDANSWGWAPSARWPMPRRVVVQRSTVPFEGRQRASQGCSGGGAGGGCSKQQAAGSRTSAMEGQQRRAERGTGTTRKAMATQGTTSDEGPLWPQTTTQPRPSGERKRWTVWARTTKHGARGLKKDTSWPCLAANPDNPEVLEL